MLQSLSIENYTLIKRVHIDFADGFSVITGETGAGKSILLGAIALLTGQRADTSVLYDKTKKSIVEAEFAIKGYGLEEFFEENDIDYDNQCIIRREITPQGKSRAFINDTPVALNVLKKIGEDLLDIHAQHTNLLLQNKDFQLILVDQYAQLQEEIATYQQHYKQYINLKKEYDFLFTKDINTDKDYWKFLYKELEDAHLQVGEQQELESNLEILSNAEEIKRQLYTVSQQLQENEGNVLSNLHDCHNRMQSIEKYKKEIQTISERLYSQIVELKDILLDVDKLQEDTMHDPFKIDQFTQRLDEIYTLQKKHKVNTEEQLLEIRQTIENKLQAMASLESKKEEITAAIAQLETHLHILAQQLSDKRKQIVGKMETDIKSVLHFMNMPHAIVNIRLEKTDTLNNRGFDKCVFYFTANLGTTTQPVHAIASGGELSRLMLAMKSLISQKNILPTIIFDEIDSGVSGEISTKMAKVMQKIAGYSQVIAITHVPQIAAKGSKHYLVYKETKDEKAISTIKELSSDDRIYEIAKMISNEQITDSAIDAAKHLLKS